MTTGYSRSQHRNDSLQSTDDDEDYSIVQNPHQSYLNAETVRTVDKLKKIIRDKIECNYKLNQAIIELEVFKIRAQSNPDEYDLQGLKMSLPADLKTCPDTLLRLSMAYGDDQRKLNTVIQEKMNRLESNFDPDTISIHTMIGPLKQLKKDIERTRFENIFRAVRSIKDQDTNKATRLFLSEVLHFAPGLKNYEFNDAESAVKAILNTTYESNAPEDILTITKTLQDTNDIRDYLNKRSDRLKQTTRLSTTSEGQSILDNEVQRRPEVKSSNVVHTFTDRSKESSSESRHLPPDRSPTLTNDIHRPTYPNSQLEEPSDRSRHSSNGNMTTSFASNRPKQ